MNDDSLIIIKGSWKGVYKAEREVKEIACEDVSSIHKNTVEPGPSYINPYQYYDSCIVRKKSSEE